jgi:hypothetical protein
MKKKEFTENRKRQIASLRRQGKTYEEIGQLMGITRQRVEQLDESTPRTRYSTMQSGWVNRYLRGENAYQIAEKDNVAYMVVRYQLKKAGLILKDGRRK